jgi:hypothetical protein
MSILCLQRCCPTGPTFVTVLSMENMATALLHAGQMALHIDRIEWGKRTRQSQGSYRCPQDGGVVHGPRHSFHSSFNTLLVYYWVRGVGSISWKLQWTFMVSTYTHILLRIIILFTHTVSRRKGLPDPRDIRKRGSCHSRSPRTR